MTTVYVPIAEARTIARTALQAVGFGHAASDATTEALILADRDGIGSHGLARLPFYLAQARSGKVRAEAVPRVEQRGAVVRVDAGCGLAFPAVHLGLEAAAPIAAELGIVAVSIAHSHHFGVAGHPVEKLARAGLIGLAFSNTPAALPPWGGKRALYGTNPIAFSAPRGPDEPIVIDLSLSKVARGKVMLKAKAGEPIPEGWAIDRDGKPTTDAEAALKGAMLPAGDAKGAALALMVELLTAGLTGSQFGHQASSLFDANGPPPDLGQLIIVLAPNKFAEGFEERVTGLAAAILEQDGARLPGLRRFEQRAKNTTTIPLDRALLDELSALATQSART